MPMPTLKLRQHRRTAEVRGPQMLTDTRTDHRRWRHSSLLRLQHDFAVLSAPVHSPKPARALTQTS